MNINDRIRRERAKRYYQRRMQAQLVAASAVIFMLLVGFTIVLVIGRWV